MKGLTVENQSNGILSEYIIHYAALFPGLPSFFSCFVVFVFLFVCLFVVLVLCFAFSITHISGRVVKKRGKPREHLAHE